MQLLLFLNKPFHAQNKATLAFLVPFIPSPLDVLVILVVNASLKVFMIILNNQNETLHAGASAICLIVTLFKSSFFSKNFQTFYFF